MAVEVSQHCQENPSPKLLSIPLMRSPVLLQEGDDGMEKAESNERDAISPKEEQFMMPHVSPIEVEKHLKGMSYPTNKKALLTHAQQQGASQNVLEVLKELREERFNSPIEVNKALGEVERR